MRILQRNEPKAKSDRKRFHLLLMTDGRSLITNN
jgi:hypothetical protein